MNQLDIATLADKVTKKKNISRKTLVTKKCHEKELKENRPFVFEKEITLTAQEKTDIMKEAFDFVLSDFPYEERGGLKSLIGTELNFRKKSRKEQSKEILKNAVAKHEQKFGSVSEKELLEMKNALREEEEFQRAIELQIEKGKAVRDENGNLIIFNAKNDE